MTFKSGDRVRVKDINRAFWCDSTGYKHILTGGAKAHLECNGSISGRSDSCGDYLVHFDDDCSLYINGECLERVMDTMTLAEAIRTQPNGTILKFVDAESYLEVNDREARYFWVQGMDTQGDASSLFTWEVEVVDRLNPPAISTNGEVRVTSSTGGEKGQKPARMSLVPHGALMQLLEHYGRGEDKYPTGEDNIPNFRKGYDWSLSYDAMMRHAMQFWQGEDVDPETGTPHIIATAWHALTLAQYMIDHPEFDNRPDVAMRKEK